MMTNCSVLERKKKKIRKKIRQATRNGVVTEFYANVY